MRIPYYPIAKRGVSITEVEFPPPIGTEIRQVYGNFNDRLYHVRGIVDNRIVVRSWQRGRRRRWSYEVFDEWWWYFKKFGNEHWVVLPRVKS